MPFVPSIRFVLLALVPLLFGAVSALEPESIWPMLIADAALAALAALDAFLGRPVLVRAEREPPRIFSVGRANLVRLRLTSRSRAPASGAGQRRRRPGAGGRGLAEDGAGARRGARRRDLPRAAEAPRALRAGRSPSALDDAARACGGGRCAWRRATRCASTPTCRRCAPTSSWRGRAWRTGWCAPCACAAARTSSRRCATTSATTTTAPSTGRRPPGGRSSSPASTSRSATSRCCACSTAAA